MHLSLEELNIAMFETGSGIAWLQSTRYVSELSHKCDFKDFFKTEAQKHAHRCSTGIQAAQARGRWTLAEDVYQVMSNTVLFSSLKTQYNSKA